MTDIASRDTLTSSRSSCIRRGTIHRALPDAPPLADAPANSPGAHAAPDDASPLDHAIANATDCLAAQQFPEGHWCAELQGDNTLESEYILLRFILGQEADPDLPLLANYIRDHQTPTGGWNLYAGGADDISATAKAYFALKLLGDDPASPHMKRARDAVHRLGGAELCNSYSSFYFAALGQISWDACPAIPPEIILLPKWFYFNLYKVSAWTRTMIVPLSIVSTFRPVRHLPARLGIPELFSGRPGPLSQVAAFPTSWRQLFLWNDQALKEYARLPIRPSRKAAIQIAEKWLLEHMDGIGGLGAIFPPMVYILIVLRLLGYADDHKAVQHADRYLRELFVRDGDRIRIAPCHSPVWDTAIALIAMADAGVDHDTPVARRGARWLLDKEVRFSSDWQLSCPSVEPSGWYFEFDNAHYPDVDDTAMVLMALQRNGGPAARSAIRRGLDWLLAFQNDDGGWAAFDRTKDRPLLEKVPFADHNAMQDPSCPDLTGRVLECFGYCGFPANHPAVPRAIAFLQKHQDPSGGWFGRWGVNYIYGTWQVLIGLKAIGADMDQPFIRKAADWLRNCQKPDGSWGETCDSYIDPSLKGQGHSTPSQTAWAIMGLIAADGPSTPAVARGIDWLIRHQRPDGNWDEHYFTGTGFPKVFYLKYHLYRLYFPLMALARHREGKAL